MINNGISGLKMKQAKTFRELQKELRRLYDRLRPKSYISHWTDKPEIRKRIDKLLDTKYIKVDNIREKQDLKYIETEQLVKRIQKLMNKIGELPPCHCNSNCDERHYVLIQYRDVMYYLTQLIDEIQWGDIYEKN